MRSRHHQRIANRITRLGHPAQSPKSGSEQVLLDQTPVTAELPQEPKKNTTVWPIQRKVQSEAEVPSRRSHQNVLTVL